MVHWSKTKKREEVINKLSNTRKKRIKEGKFNVWNKGLKGVQVAWNKGLKFNKKGGSREDIKL